MLRNILIAILAISSSMLMAEYRLEVIEPSWSHAAPPVTRVYVHIERDDTRPFSGEIVISANTKLLQPSAGAEYSLEINMEENAKYGEFQFDIPVGQLSKSLIAVLYRGTDRSQPMVRSAVYFNRKIYGSSVAFISRGRLAALNGWLPHNISEIPYLEVPTNWRCLRSFTAIILNDDRISTQQVNALMDYVTAGGTLIISPHTTASLNPETPAGKLLNIISTQPAIERKLSEFSALLLELDVHAEPAPPPEPKRRGGRETVKEAPAATSSPEAPPELAKPEPDSVVNMWRQSGRAVPLAVTTGMRGLVSRARVGAGQVIFLHVNISEAPFCVGQASEPSQALANLLLNSLKGAGHEKNVMTTLVHSPIENFTGIASKRIPGQAFVMISLFIYLLAAGAGLYFLVRKLKRPEFYPVGLMLFAVISVVLVFGGGEVLKRTGSKMVAVRVILADESTTRTAIFDMVCSYQMDGDTKTLQSNDQTMFLPTGHKLNPDASGFERPPIYNMKVQGFESSYEMRDLERWQNVFHKQLAPTEADKARGLVVTVQDGSWIATNNGSLTLSNLVVGINSGSGTASGGMVWFYVAELAAGEQASLSAKTARVPVSVMDFANAVRANSDDEAEAMLALLSLSGSDWRHGNTETRLKKLASVTSVERNVGDFVALASLPSTALAKKTLGGVDIEDDDIDQHILLLSTGIVKE